MLFYSACVVAYLVVGFIIAVLTYTDYRGLQDDDGMPVPGGIVWLFWPCAIVLVAFGWLICFLDIAGDWMGYAVEWMSNVVGATSGFLKSKIRKPPQEPTGV